MFWVLLVVRAQLNLEAPQTQAVDESFVYYTQNLLVGGAPAPPFALSFDQNAASTLWEGTAVNETHVTNTISTPRVHWYGEFELRSQLEVQTLAFAQMAGESGVAWCDGVVYEGAKKWPAACTSDSAVHARCTPDHGCRYAATVDNDNDRRVLAKADPHAKVECELQLTLVNGIRTCASKDAVFNPLEVGASIVQRRHFQSLYFNRQEDNGPAGAVFAIIIILCLVVWVKNMPEFVEGTNAKRTTKIAWGISDLAVTVASASIFAIAEGGTAYVPPEIETIGNTGPPQIWFGVYVATVLGGSAIATATALVRPMHQGKSPLAAVARIALEVQLLAALHFHLPTTMGLALRRTLGFFVGVAALVVIGRDFPGAITQLPKTATLILAVWTSVAVVHIVMTLLLPTIAQSAGIADKTATEFAVATATATIAFAVVRLSV